MLHICKLLKRMAKNRVTGILNLIDRNKSDVITKQFNQLSKQLKHAKEHILRSYPNETTTLNNFIRDTVSEYCEDLEIKTEKTYRPNEVCLDVKSVINLTNIDIPEDVRLTASFGPKFCFDTDDDLLNNANFLTHTKNSLERGCPIETYCEIYKQISIELSEKYKTFSTNDTWTEFLKYRFLKFRKIHPDILITRSDKGKHTVFVHKDEYHNKMLQLISQQNDYIEIPDIDIEGLQNQNNNFVEELVHMGAIKATERHFYIDKCCNTARMYGLFKIHKESLPLRPITSACSSPGFKLSGFFADMLSRTYDDQGFHVLGSSYIIDDLNKLTIQPDETLVSFDVVSMFTNIAIDKMLHIIRNKADFIHNTYHIPFNTLEKVMIFLLRECAVFTYNKKFYKQRDSLAMGSPLSPILAKILMNDILNHIIPNRIEPKFVALYVDDSLWLLKRNMVSMVLNLLNDYDPRIRFTCERENELFSINFLDITIMRTANNRLITRWYKKPFASLRLINYHSHHDKSCIVQTAVAMVKTIIKLSHPVFFVENRELIKEMLKLNSFPQTHIISIINKYCTYMKGNINSTKYFGKYIPIYYQGSLSTRLKNKLYPLLHGARIVTVPNRNGTKISSQIKSKIRLEDKTNVVLSLTCHCKSKLILRKTGYLLRAKPILDDLKNKYNYTQTGKCNTTHKFGRLSHFQVKNFSMVNNMYHMIAYAHRRKLTDTTFSPPIAQFSKHLKITASSQQRIAKYIFRSTKTISET